MALTFKKTSSGLVGLDIDGAFLAAAEVSGRELKRSASVDLQPSLFADGEVSDSEGLSSVLKDFFKDNNLPTRVRLGVANQQIVVRQLELPWIDDAGHRDAAIRFQASTAIAMPLEEAVLDYQQVGLDQPDGGTPQARYVVVAARKAMIERLLETARMAGLKPEGIDLNAFALVRALAPDPADETTRAYCHLGGVTNLAVATGTCCVFTRTLSAAWTPDGELDAGVLAEEIRLSIDFHLAQPDAKPIAELFLSGPGSTIEGLVEHLGSVGLPVTVVSPLGHLTANGGLGQEDPHRLTVAAGLAMGAQA
jgi:type IV pilus assembly protein PilM